MSEAITARAGRLERLRPPLSRLLLDVDVPAFVPSGGVPAGASGRARWLLLPLDLTGEVKATQATAYAVEPASVTGAVPEVVTVRGTPGFHAVAVARGAHLRLRGLPLRVTGPPPGVSFTVRAAWASALRFDEPSVPVTDTPTGLRGAVDWDSLVPLKAWSSPGYAPVPVQLVHLVPVLVTVSPS
jgi:hypothetical protein